MLHVQQTAAHTFIPLLNAMFYISQSTKCQLRNFPITFHSSKCYFRSWLHFLTDINSHRSLPKLTVSDRLLERNHRDFFFFSSINPFPPSSSGLSLLTNGSTHVLFSMKLSFILHDNGSWGQPLLRRKDTMGWLRKLPDVEIFDVLPALVNVLWCFDERNPVEGLILLCTDIMVSTQLC